MSASRSETVADGWRVSTKRTATSQNVEPNPSEARTARLRGSGAGRSGPRPSTLLGAP